MTAVKPGKKAPSKFVLGAKNQELQKKTDRPERIFILRIPAQLYKEAGGKAASRTITLHQFILDAIEKASRTR